MPKVIIIDVETTGLEPTDKVVEIAGLEVNIDWQSDKAVPQDHIKIDRLYEQLVDPQQPIPVPAMAVHHITDEMVMGRVVNQSVVVDDMIKTLDIERLDYIVAHNAAYDKQYLGKEFNPVIPWICTYKVAHHLYPDFPSHKNAAVYYALGLHTHERFGPIGDKMLHRAGPDAAITGAIFWSMCQLISLEDMVEVTNRPILLKRVGFGKHFGKSWDEVDGGYLDWLLGKADDFDENVIYTARCQKLERAKR